MMARPWSITARLTALFTVTTTLLVTVVVTVLYYAISSHLQEEHEHLVAEVARVLQHSLASGERSASAIVQEMSAVESDQPATYSDPYGVRIYDSAGRVLGQSAGMAVPHQAFRGIRATLQGNRATPERWTAPNGNSFLLAKIDTGTFAPAKPATVELALNVTRDGDLMSDLRLITVVVLALSLIAAAIAGASVVRLSLRPVQRVASEVSVISARQLEKRLSVDDRPRELLRLVTSFNTMLDRLERAFAGLGEYAENLAHELRTPLNNLKGEAEVALLNERSPDQYREVLSSSLEEYDRLARMVDGLLFLARAESHETKPQWSMLQLGEITQGACEFYEGVAEERQATLSVEGEAEVEADAVLVRRAISNLLSNAISHLRPGGQVRVVIEQTTGGGASLHVIDDGSGIAASDLPRVTDRFFRSSETRRQGIAGSGLGLAIVRSIMDLHNGAIDIASTEGVGTKVTLRFPDATRA